MLRRQISQSRLPAKVQVTGHKGHPSLGQIGGQKARSHIKFMVAKSDRIITQLVQEGNFRLAGEELEVRATHKEVPSPQQQASLILRTQAFNQMGPLAK